MGSAQPDKGRPLRILVAHNVSRVRNGGMSRLMGLIHDRVAADGHQVDYFCSEDLPAFAAGRRSRVLFPFMVLRHARAKGMGGVPYDIINIHEPHAAAVIAGRALLGNPRIAVTSHGVEQRGWMTLLEDAKAGRQRLKTSTRITYPLLTLSQSSFGLRHADHIFCLNQDDRQFVMERMNRTEPDVTCIRPGVNACYGAKASSRDYSSAANLIFAGTWVERKGVKDLEAAFRCLSQLFPCVTLTVLGAGVPERDVLQRFPLQLRSRIIFRHARDDFEAAAVMSGADLFVLPSLFEGTPLTMIEAMASGMPIVTTAVCGMKDTIRDGENGLLVPVRSPGAIVEAVSRLLRSRELRERLGRAAHAEALANYSWDQVAEPVKTVYRRLSCDHLDDSVAI